eukprot:scaffold125734_cov39-Phaeocystis_antarctica.AAC.1
MSKLLNLLPEKGAPHALHGAPHPCPPAREGRRSHSLTTDYVVLTPHSSLLKGLRQAGPEPRRGVRSLSARLAAAGWPAQVHALNMARGGTLPAAF